MRYLQVLANTSLHRSQTIFIHINLHISPSLGKLSLIHFILAKTAQFTVVIPFKVPRKNRKIVPNLFLSHIFTVGFTVCFSVFRFCFQHLVLFLSTHREHKITHYITMTTLCYHNNQVTEIIMTKCVIVLLWQQHDSRLVWQHCYHHENIMRTLQCGNITMTTLYYLRICHHGNNAVGYYHMCDNSVISPQYHRRVTMTTFLHRNVTMTTVLTQKLSSRTQGKKLVRLDMAIKRRHVEEIIIWKRWS